MRHERLKRLSVQCFFLLFKKYFRQAQVIHKFTSLLLVYVVYSYIENGNFQSTFFSKCRF